MFKFNITNETLNTLNNASKVDAFFKYIKNVSKNKTPIIIQGEKIENYWICNLYECAIPASKFSTIKIPAENDPNKEHTSFSISLSEKILNQFVDGSSFTFNDTDISIKRGNVTIKDSYKESIETIKDRLKEFIPVINTDTSSFNTSLKLTKESKIVNLLKDLKTNPDASIYITEKDITFRNGSVFFRTINTEDFKSENFLYLNMYLAIKILNILDYSNSIEIYKTDNNIILIGFDENQNEIVKNVSAIYDVDSENPTNEDLAGITPKEENSTIVSINLLEFLESVESQKSLVSYFTSAKYMEAKLFENGKGLSLNFESTNSVDTSMVTLNVGEVENEEVPINSFTNYSTILPTSLLKMCLESNEQNLKIVFDNTEDTAVLFETLNYKILSGKLM